MIANSCFHRWRNPQGLMNPAKVVVHVMKRNRVLQILQLFAERIGQSREATHRHSHCQVLALNVARRDMVVVGAAADDSLASAHADSGTISRIRAILRRAVNLLQHRKVDLFAESILDCFQVGAMAVCRELHTIRQTRPQILDEMMRCSRMAATDKPARNELRIGVKCNPCPAITRSCRLLVKVAISFLRVNEGPNLIALGCACTSDSQKPYPDTSSKHGQDHTADS
jgi:hypothetical protein